MRGHNRDRMNARPTGTELGDWRKASRPRRNDDWRIHAEAKPTAPKKKAGKK